MSENQEYSKLENTVNTRDQPRIWHKGEEEGSMSGDDDIVQPGPFMHSLSSTPKGEAVGAVRQVEEPPDVQVGDEHL